MAGLKDFYAVLGVPENATADEIKSAYRRLVMRFHPDHQTDATDAERAKCAERFREITEAWETLSNPQRRARYDKQREAAGGGTATDWDDADFGPGPQPQFLDITNEPVAITAILEALRAGQVPGCYIRAGSLVTLETHVSDTTGAESVQVVDVIPHRLRGMLHERVPCIRFDRKGIGSMALPGVGTCLTLLQRREWPGMKVLRGVVHAPVLRPDGGLLQRPGWDRQTGLYLHPSLAVKPVPSTPTVDDIAEAKYLLTDLLLADFPWAGEADRANYLAALITPVLRPLTGLSPFYAVDAPERGSGKTLLAVNVPGTVHGAKSLPFPTSNEETRKTILSVLRGANTSPVIVFDNVPASATVNAASLAMLLTSDEFTDRVLGGSKVVELPNDRLWMVTGTNLKLGGDIPQRTVRVELNYAKPRPDLRSGFKVQYATAGERLGKHPDAVTEAEARQYGGDLDTWLAAHAADVLHALLVLARAWVLADMPLSEHVFRNYTRWAQVCGGLLEYHGLGDGFLAAGPVPDTDAEIWAPFLSAWKGIFGKRPVKVRDLLEEDRLEDTMPIERDAASVNEDDNVWAAAEPTQSELSKLGGELKIRRGRWFADPGRAGWYLAAQSKVDKHSKVNVWFIESRQGEETKAPRSPRTPRPEVGG